MKNIPEYRRDPITGIVKRVKKKTDNAYGLTDTTNTAGSTANTQNTYKPIEPAGSQNQNSFKTTTGTEQTTASGSTGTNSFNVTGNDSSVPEGLTGTAAAYYKKITGTGSSENNGFYDTTTKTDKKENTYKIDTEPKHEREGTRIKNNMIKALGSKSEEPGYKHLFDDIDDDTIENSLSLADEAIALNKTKGLLTDEKIKKMPYYRDGLAMFYAAAEKNQNKASKIAKDIAYTEVDEPLFGDIDMGDAVLSTYGVPHSNSVADKRKEIIPPWKDCGPTEEESKEGTIYYGDIQKDEPKKDLYYGDLTKEELIEGDWINWSDFLNDEELHIKNWRYLATLTSMGDNDGVVQDLISHFIDGTGTDYSSDALTEMVENHKRTNDYMRDFSRVFDMFLQIYRGDYKQFANTDEFKKALKRNDVLLSKYDYGGMGDLFGGLYMAIHSWTESWVEITSLDVSEDGTYSGNLKFTFRDNFGLDPKDVSDFGEYAGFRSWYILQHYDQYKGKYRPFKTVVEIDYPITGRIPKWSLYTKSKRTNL